jgi:phage N-6-adenine-methyltransferase
VSAEYTPMKRTIKGTDNRAVIVSAKTRNNGRYNGNGREWATPPEVFDPLHAEFGFTLDVCATPQNAKLPRYLTEAEDGLLQPWEGHRVWMNPPYGREVYNWTAKARDEVELRGCLLVVALLPASTDLKWWHDDIDGRAEVRYIRGRVRFLTDGPYRASGFFPSVIVIWRSVR